MHEEIYSPTIDDLAQTNCERGYQSRRRLLRSEHESLRRHLHTIKPLQEANDGTDRVPALGGLVHAENETYDNSLRNRVCSGCP